MINKEYKSSNIINPSSFSEEDVHKMFCDYKHNKNNRLRNKLAVRNQALVTFIINKYYSAKMQHQVLRDDLLQEGNIGLLSAIDGFDPDKGFKFSTYACVPLTTEILTKRGWKRYNDLKKDDETIGYNNGRSEWTKINGVKVYDNAPLVKFSNDNWSAICTDQHKWLVEDESGNAKLVPLNELGDSPEIKLITSAKHKENYCTSLQDDPLNSMSTSIIKKCFGDDMFNFDYEELGSLLAFLNGEQEVKHTKEKLECTNGVFEYDFDTTTFTKKETKKYKVEPCGEGPVWCPNTDLGSWTARTSDGHIFLTGNTWWIRQAINNYLINTEPTIHVPPHVKTAQNKLMRKLKEENMELQEMIHDYSSNQQDFPLTNNMMRNINLAMNTRTLKSLEEEVMLPDASKATLKDLVETKEKSADQKIDRTIVINNLKESFKKLSPKEKLILLLRYNVINNEEVPLLCQMWKKQEELK